MVLVAAALAQPAAGAAVPLAPWPPWPPAAQAAKEPSLAVALVPLQTAAERVLLAQAVAPEKLSAAGLLGLGPTPAVVPVQPVAPGLQGLAAVLALSSVELLDSLVALSSAMCRYYQPSL